MTDSQGTEKPIVAKPKVVLTHPDGREIELYDFFIVGFQSPTSKDIQEVLSDPEAPAELVEATKVEVVTTVNLDAMVFIEGVVMEIVDKYRNQQEQKEGTFVQGAAAIVEMNTLKPKQ